MDGDVGSDWGSTFGFHVLVVTADGWAAATSLSCLVLVSE